MMGCAAKTVAPFQQEKTWNGLRARYHDWASGLFQKRFQAESQFPSGGISKKESPFIPCAIQTS